MVLHRALWTVRTLHISSVQCVAQRRPSFARRVTTCALRYTLRHDLCIALHAFSFVACRLLPLCFDLLDCEYQLVLCLNLQRTQAALPECRSLLLVHARLLRFHCFVQPPPVGC
jgi:hypothetical protein